MSKAMGRWKLDGGQCYERQSFILRGSPSICTRIKDSKLGADTPGSEQSQPDSLNMLWLLETFF